MAFGTEKGHGGNDGRGSQALVTELEVFSHEGSSSVSVGNGVPGVSAMHHTGQTPRDYSRPCGATFSLSGSFGMDGWFWVLAARSTRDRILHLSFTESLELPRMVVTSAHGLVDDCGLVIF